MKKKKRIKGLVSDKKTLIQKLEGHRIRTNETYGFYARVTGGIIDVVDVPLTMYSVRSLQIIASQAKPRVFGLRKRDRSAIARTLVDMF